MGCKQKKISIYPTEKMSERLNVEYANYLIDFDTTAMSKPLSKAAFILWLVRVQLDRLSNA